jgi:hypothetical protein
VLFQHYLAAGHVLATGTNRTNLSGHVFSWQRDTTEGQFRNSWRFRRVG